jgi:hypothetical protein
MGAIPFWGGEGADGPDYSEQPWDIITFVVDQRLLQSPGIAVVKCVTKERIDQQKPNGGDVGVAITRGHDPARIDIQIKVWTESQWEKLQELMEALWRKSGGANRQDRTVTRPKVRFKTAQETQAAALAGGNATITERIKTSDADATKAAAISMSHPATNLYGIGAIIIESTESIDVGADLIGTLRIKAIQYNPPSKKNVTRKREGAGRVAQVKEHQINRNQGGPSPSKTDGLPALPRTPARGSS